LLTLFIGVLLKDFNALADGFGGSPSHQPFASSADKQGKEQEAQ
jgi:hypothetical protein